MYGSLPPAPLNSRYSYYTIFSDICKTRFSHLATRLLLTLSIILATGLAFASGDVKTTWERALGFPMKLLLLYSSLLLVIIVRKNYLHVQFLGHTNIISLIYDQFFSSKFILYQLTHFLSSILINWALNSVFYSPHYYIPVIYHRLTVWFLVPFVYSLQHLLFDLGRLSFSYGYHHEQRENFISDRLHDSVAKCAILTLVVSFIQPFCYFALTSQFYAGFLAHLQCICISFIILQLWDATNIAFNAYLSIGCLHKGKPISSLSSTPMETLVTGLSSKRLFTKLTAFQELSYRSTSPDVQLRIPIYHTRHGASHIWSNMLKECLIVIQETNNNISTFLKSLEAHTAESSEMKQKVIAKSENEALFGNMPLVSSTGASVRLPGSSFSTEGDISQRISFESRDIYVNGPKLYQGMKTSHSYNPPIFTQQTSLLNMAHDLYKYSTDKLSSFFFPSQADAPESIKPLSFFELCTISKKRQAEKLVPLPSCYAECIITLMGMLINALDEDPKGSVVSSVGEVLKILERSVGTLGAFVEWEAPNKIEKGPDAISILYDLAINAFLEIVLKYNQLLNDVYLDDDVVKLSRWVLQICDE